VAGVALTSLDRLELDKNPLGAPYLMHTTHDTTKSPAFLYK